MPTCSTACCSTAERIAGFIDFYYARCNDVLLYDLAIAVNDWAMQPDGDLDAGRAQALIDGYTRCVRRPKPNGLHGR